MDFVVFVNAEKDFLVEQVQLPNNTILIPEKGVFDFSQMEDFVEYKFSIFYSNGKIENAILLSIGKEEDGTPMFTYDLLDDRKGDLEDD